MAAALQAASQAAAAFRDAADGTTIPPTPTLPTVSVSVSPVAITVGQVVQVTAFVTSTTAVSQVEFLVDGVVVSTDTAAPWSWSTSTLSVGTHQLQARARNAAGAMTSAAKTVVVSAGGNTGGGTLLPLRVAAQQGSTPSQLATSDGKRFVGRGLNYAYHAFAYNYPGDTQMPAVNAWGRNNAASIARFFAGKGVNFVRLPVNNQTDAAFVASLKTICEANAAAGIRTMLVAFGGIGSTPNAACGQLLASLWTQLGKPVHVLLNVINEPHQIGDDVWQSGNLAALGPIRAAGYTQPVFMDGQNWAWSLPLAQARAIVAQDSQCVFMSHRYAFDGSTIRTAADAAAWTAEWSQAPDLCKGVGEYGWFNGGGNSTSIGGWCKPMTDAQVAAVQAGWLSVSLSWTSVWDQNSELNASAPPPGEPTSSNRDWYAISKGAPYDLNAWGVVAAAAWPAMAAVAP